MIRRLRARALLGPTLALGVISSFAACGEDTKASASVDTRTAPHAPASDPASQLEAFQAEPKVAALLAILATPHQTIRERELGAHSIRYQAHFELAPRDGSKLPPRVGEQIRAAFDVDDELELRWAPSSDGHPRAWLRQSNNHEDRREILLLAGKAYTRLHEETWYVRELDGDLHERWFAEAYASVHDMVEFAAPQLQISGVSEGQTATGAAALVVELGLSAGRDESLGRDGEPSRWRASSRMDSVEGRVALDPKTGAWLEADLSLKWRMSDGAQRPLAGQSSMKASLSPGEVEIAAPAGAEPMPERHRYELERDALLDGLAAP